MSEKVKLIVFGFLLVSVAFVQQALATDVKQEEKVVISKVFLRETMPLYRVELASEALSVWRQYASSDTTLILLSNDPMLSPVPGELVAKVSSFVLGASQTDIAQQSSPQNSAVTFLPNMTVDIATRAGWFGQIVWLIPEQNKEQELSVERLQGQFLEAGLASDQEVKSFKADGQRIVGEIRNSSWTIQNSVDLPELKGPVILHIDQSYFAKLYKNEVATPLMPLVINVLNSLRTDLQVKAVTFSYGNLDHRVSLDVRFIGDLLAGFIERPDIFEKPVASGWRYQSDILYLQNFFKTEEILKLAKEMENKRPESAWVKFSLYRAAQMNKLGTEALKYLSEAVNRDKAYALEYESLSDLAYEKGRPKEALRMLGLAANAFPGNFGIKLKMAKLSAELGDKTTALHLVEQLRGLSWSPVYFPDMPEYLKGFKVFLEKEDEPQPKKNPGPMN